MAKKETKQSTKKESKVDEKILQELKEQIKDLEASILYSKAESENARKRALEDIEKARKFAVEKFCQEILLVKDSLDAALTIEKASLEETNFTFSYEDQEKYFFMNPKTFEQTEIQKSLIGEKGKLLTENLEVTISFYNDNPISVNLPNQVTCKIETTDVALKGQTVSSSYKPATLNNGLNIQVPPFIDSGDEVIVDTRNLEYIKKI